MVTTQTTQCRTQTPPPPQSPVEKERPLVVLMRMPELVPLVLWGLRRPSDMASAARVCRYWNHILRPSLYSHLSLLPWEPAPKAKFLGVFDTLSSNPDLCKQVESLSVHFFPLDLQGDAMLTLENRVQTCLALMENLTSLAWTRDRTVYPQLFGVITSLPHITKLEISGHSSLRYNPVLLGSMAQLEDLAVMMPDVTFCAALPGIVRDLAARERGGLKALSLVCKSGNFINDALLQVLAPHLSGLRRLVLLGSTRIRKQGVYALLESGRIEELKLDISPHSDLLDLSDAPGCANLKTLSLSIPPPRHKGSGSPECIVEDDLPLLPASELTALELSIASYGVGPSHRTLTASTLEYLSRQVDFSRLTRLALLNFVVCPQRLRDILRNALDELYVTVADYNTLESALQLGAFDNCPLTIFHANTITETTSPRNILSQLARTMPRLQQIGSGTTIYEVHRGVDGLSLVRWSNANVGRAGYFKVWRP